jgi:putative transposase
VDPRNIKPGITYLLTRRCIERRFLLRPSALTNQIIEYCLGVAAERTGVELHVFCAMSNHIHAVVTDVKGRLPEFIHQFHRNVAVAINASLSRTENVWAAGKTSVVELGEESDIIDKMAYLVANPTTAGLVRRPKEWPGVITTRLRETKTVKRPKGFFRDEGNMPKSSQLRYTVPALLAHHGEKTANELFQVAVAQLVRAAQSKMDKKGRAFLSANAIRAQPVSKSAFSKELLRQANPRFAIQDLTKRLAAIARWKSFLLAYRDAFLQWRNGEHKVRFPEGTWLMSHIHGAACGPPGACPA